MMRLLVRCLWLPIALAICPSVVWAGIASPNVVVVVNANSTDSITLANHYIDQRDIPPSNVIWLDDVPAGLTVPLNDFRARILRPLLNEINQRKLAAQTLVIAYSAGFPTGVKISEHTKRLNDENQRKFQTPTASINSLTFFYQWVLSDRADYLGWTANFYARGPFVRHFVNPFSGDNAKRFEQAKSLGEEGDHEASAELYHALAKQFPTISPLHLLAAQQAALADQPERALEQIRSAARSGWTSRRYMQETPELAKLFSAELEIETTHEARQRLLNRFDDRPIEMQGSVGFSAANGWTSSGHRVEGGTGAISYLLSCLLGVIHENGSTLEQAIEVLERAAQADRTYPDAIFGFSRTGDVRTLTRQPGYADALAWLLNRDQSVEVFSSVLPTQPKDYVGLSLGAARLNTQDRKWRMVPGAIADNLTSLGGAFGSRSQTRCTALLHAGAAMSSGAVAEPYSIQVKFPHPIMYAYYHEGVTALEAFYLSVRSPYQLLIVGDPLCQPYARAPTDFIDTEFDHDTQRLTIRWQPIRGSARNASTAAIELYLDDRLVAHTAPQPSIQATINQPADAKLSGFLPCRAVLIGDDPAESRIAYSASVSLGNEDRFPHLQRLRKDLPDKLTVYVECPGAEQIEVQHLGRTVATVSGASGRVTLSEEQVGRGPIRLRIIGTSQQQKMLGQWTRLVW